MFELKLDDETYNVAEVNIRDIEKDIAIKNNLIGKAIEAYIKYSTQENRLEFLLPLLASALQNSDIHMMYDKHGEYRVTTTYIPLYDNESIRFFGNAISLHGDNNNDKDIVYRLIDSYEYINEVETHIFNFRVVMGGYLSTKISTDAFLEIKHIDWDKSIWNVLVQKGGK